MAGPARAKGGAWGRCLPAAGPAPRRCFFRRSRPSCWNTRRSDRNSGRGVMEATSRTQPLAREAMAYVLAGGRGSRLKELTDRRAKPAVYFGGKTRIIDFALSNALNSGIRRLGVATQYKAHSLIRHLQRGWNFLRPERNESFDILPASQRVSETQWRSE